MDLYAMQALEEYNGDQKNRSPRWNKRQTVLEYSFFSIFIRSGISVPGNSRLQPIRFHRIRLQRKHAFVHRRELDRAAHTDLEGHCPGSG